MTKVITKIADIFTFVLLTGALLVNILKFSEYFLGGSKKWFAVAALAAAVFAFYALGGSSVTSMELVSKCPLRRLDIGMIYQGRTPRKIAKIWQEAIQAADAAADRDADPAKPCPLTQTQMGIYAECARHPGEAIYNNPVLLRFPADTDAGRLQHAVETAVKAHPGLFAQIIPDESGLPAMVYRPDWAEEALCEITDSTEAAFTARKSALAAPFNILEDRLFRMGALQHP